MSMRTLLAGLFLGQRADLGHGSERQAARWLWGIRPDHRHRYRFASAVVGGGAVLDVACGVGYGSYMLGRAHPGRTVLGRDRCARTIGFARRSFGRRNVAFECGDALDMPGRDRFDAIVSLETLEHIDDEERFLEVLHRLARRRCTLVISTPNERCYPFVPSFNPHHVRHHTPEQLDHLLASTGWEVVSRHCQRTSSVGRVVAGTDGRFIVYVAERA